MSKEKKKRSKAETGVKSERKPAKAEKEDTIAERSE